MAYLRKTSRAAENAEVALSFIEPVYGLIMILNTFPVQEIGIVARELLMQEQEALVIGVSRHGIFLRLSMGWVIFLSYESFRGPLTLNIGEFAREGLRPTINAAAKVIPEGIFFPELGFGLLTGSAQIWQISPPSLPVSTLSQCRSRLKEVAFELIARGKTSEIGAALPAILGFGAAEAEASGYLSQMIRVKDAFRQRDAYAIVQALQVFCGVGRGLTPGGDDLIMGFLLALNRWRDTLVPQLNLEALNLEIIKMAYRGTTNLAANLIECASRGQADERLMFALDGILTGNPPPDPCAAYLAGWGNSSGLDALTGIALAF